MCGIAGIISSDPWSDSLTAALTRMQAALRHRGPDDQGLWVDPAAGVGLAHTRLAILDLSPAGHQPMASADGRYQIVFNGEIYNFRELRASLEEEGVSFQTETDTEVLLQHLARHGMAGLSQLAGMFAFCLWDQATQCAWMARDAFGIKPLYYRQEEGTLRFASEVKALHHTTDPADPLALNEFLQWGSVVEPRTLWQNIRQVPAGHWLHFDLKSQLGRMEAWVAPAASRPSSTPVTATDLTEAAGLTRRALVESIGRHLVSDAPVGFFLSGGIDSTAIVALARQQLGPAADLRTFSIGFEEADFDESAIARRTAAHFGTHHTEWRMTATEGCAEIAAYLEAIDQPSIDGFNTWCVSKLAAKHGVKVVLSGLGGDEMFAGYPSFARLPRLRAWHRRLGQLAPFVALPFRLFPAGSRWRRLAVFLTSPGTWLDAFHLQRGIFTPDECLRLTHWLLPSQTGLLSSASELTTKAESLPPPDQTDPLEAVAWLEQQRYLRNQLLRDSDVFSMAHGLELRVPLVDWRLESTLRQLPPAIRYRQGKKLLIEAVPELPPWVLDQPKRGFQFPFQLWMEKTMGELLTSAQHEAPVPLRAWYRQWAVAVAQRQLHPRLP